MQMATVTKPAEGTRLVVRAAATTVGIFGVFGLKWTEAHLVLPLTRLQGSVAAGLFGPPPVPVEVTLACSGTDAIALCLGAILAYPVAWPRRIAGVAGGAALILGLNTVRIGTLGLAAASPWWFNALHLYAWPAVLMLAIVGYVFAWMRAAGFAAGDPPDRGRAHPGLRFASLSVLFVVLGAITAPFYLDSPRVLEAAGLVTRASAWLLVAMGASVSATANVLWTPRGAFLVTQECITTPLIPIYLAAVCAFAPTWPRLAIGVLAALPIFAALAVLRLLAAAVPAAAMASPEFFIHAFYQLLMAAVMVSVAAVWRHGGRAAPWRSFAGAVAGVMFVYMLGPVYLSAITPHASIPAADPQGAITFLPPFQVGLYLALWIAAFAAVGWPRLLAGLGVLALTQAAGLAVLQGMALPAAALTPLVPGVRAWALAGPVLILVGVQYVGRRPWLGDGGLARR